MTIDFAGYADIKERHGVSAAADVPQLSERDAASEQPRLKPLLWSELGSQPRGEPLIKKLWDKQTMSVIYGASGSYKTFLGVDLAAHVALGRPWCGRHVVPGRVLYIAGEGGGSIDLRFAAFRLHYDIEPCDQVAVLPVSVDLCHQDNDTDQVIKGAQWVFHGEPITLVVVDTLSRALAGGNENGPDDMGRFVRNCDRIRLETGAHVTVIHHTGKDATKGARGHSLLLAAVDTAIEVIKDDTVGLVTVTVTKQRDHATGDRFVFKPTLIELGKDEDDAAVTSCVLLPADSAPAAKTKQGTLTAQNRKALELLGQAIQAGGELAPADNHIPRGVRVVKTELWRDYCYKGQIADSDKPDAKRQAFGRNAKRLQDAGLIAMWDPWVWLAK